MTNITENPEHVKKYKEAAHKLIQDIQQEKNNLGAIKQSIDDTFQKNLDVSNNNPKTSKILLSYYHPVMETIENMQKDLDTIITWAKSSINFVTHSHQNFNEITKETRNKILGVTI